MILSRTLVGGLMLLYPLTDTLRAFLIRSYKNPTPFVADRIHLHHRLADKVTSIGKLRVDFYSFKFCFRQTYSY